MSSRRSNASSPFSGQMVVLSRPLPCSTTRNCRELCKTAEVMEIPFGLWPRVGPRKHYYMGVHIGAT